MEVCSASGGGVLLLGSKVFIALCRPVMSIVCIVKTKPNILARKRDHTLKRIDVVVITRLFSG